jgi:hypothetical protein
MHILEQSRIEEPSKPMESGGLLDLPTKLHVAGVVDQAVAIGMHKGETRLRRGKLINIMELDDVGGFEVLSVIVRAHFVVKLGGGDRGEEGCIRARNAYAVLCTWLESVRERTECM